MASRFTRRRFLTALGVACLALANTAGCAPLELTRKLRPLRTPKASPVHFPKVQPLQDASSAPVGGVWAFRSCPDLGPPAVEVATPAQGTAPGHIFVAPKNDPGQDGPMILDNRGELVW